MKPLIYTLLFLAVFSSCSKDTIEPKHYQVTVYVDSLVFNDASYIESSDSTAVFNVLNSEEFKSAPIASTVIFGKEGSTSIKFLGGWRNPIMHLPAQMTPELFPEGAIIDTVYKTHLVDASYAILEVTQGSETRRDTAIIDNRDILKNYQLAAAITNNFGDSIIGLNPEVYYELTAEYFYRWRYNYTGYQFDSQFSHEYYSVQLPEEDNDVYLIDILPYWQNPLTPAELIFYIKK